MKRSAGLCVASVVCALLLVAATPRCAVLALAPRRAMILSWSRLGTRCVTWAASRESSATLQVDPAGMVLSLRPGRLDFNALGQAGLIEIRVEVAAKHPCAEAREAIAACCHELAALCAETRR